MGQTDDPALRLGEEPFLPKGGGVAPQRGHQGRRDLFSRISRQPPQDAVGYLSLTGILQQQIGHGINIRDMGSANGDGHGLLQPNSGCEALRQLDDRRSVAVTTPIAISAPPPSRVRNGSTDGWAIRWRSLSARIA